MAWTFFTYVVIFFYLGSGICLVFIIKWTDMQESPGTDGVPRRFHHPIFQSVVMFFAMFFCQIVFKILYWYYSRKQDGSEDVNALTKGTRDFNVFILMVTSILDMCGSTAYLMGLSLTYASSAVMFAGGTLAFVAVLSLCFLKKKIAGREWLGILMILVGLTIIGTSNYLSMQDSDEEYALTDVITGDVLIIMAKFLMATQLIVEEKFIGGWDIPALQAVGWEGIFGLCITVPLLVPLYFIRSGRPFSINPSGRMEDMHDVWVQLSNNWQLRVAFYVFFFMLTFLNWSGITITKVLSSLTRVVLGQLTTIIVWALCIIFLDETFRWLQLVGYLTNVVGVCIYNDFTCQNQRKKLMEMCGRKQESEEN